MTTANTNQENKKAEEAPQDMEKEDEESNDRKAKSPNRTVQGMSKVGPAKQVTFAQDTPQKDQTTTNSQASVQHMSPPPLLDGDTNNINKVSQKEQRLIPKNPYIPQSTSQAPIQMTNIRQAVQANKNNVNKQVILTKRYGQGTYS